MKQYIIHQAINWSALMLTAGCAAVAQDTKKQDIKDSVFTTQPVTVTATRSATETLHVPLAVSIIPKEVIANRRGYGLDEALALVPGVLTQSRAGNHDVRIVIRGFGARGAGERSNAGTSRGIRVYLDGIPETEPDGRTAFDMIDLSGASSIEVLRSNASALWGNAAGGVVSISSVPASDSPFIEAQSQSGSFGLLKNSLRAGTLTDFGKAFVSFNNTSFDGWREHSRSANTQFNAGLVNQSGARTKFGVFLTGASNIFRIPGPLNQPQFDANPQQAQNDTLVYKPTYVARDEHRFNRLGRIGATFEHSLSQSTSVAGMAFLQTKYLQRSERNTFRDFNRYHTGGNIMLKNTMTISDDISSNFLVGADEQYQDGALLFYSLKNGGRDTLRTNKREGANNFGVFVQEELGFGEQFGVSAGARYDNITYYSEDFLKPGFSEERTYTRVTPKFGVSYRFSAEHTLYFNLGGGIEVPAGNETDPVTTFGEDTLRVINPLLEPIRSTTFELGYKTLFNTDLLFGNATVAADAAAFLISVMNDIIPYRGGRFYFTAGETRRAGAELGLSVRWANGITLYGSATYTNSVYVRYLIDSVHYDKNAAGKFSDFKGKKVAGIPDFFTNWRVRYEPDFLAGIYAEADAKFMGEYFADDANTLSVSSYAILDISAGFNLKLSEELGIQGYVRAANLTNERYVASAWINPDRPATVPPAYLEPGLPANYTAGITLRWSPEK